MKSATTQTATANDNSKPVTASEMRRAADACLDALTRATNARKDELDGAVFSLRYWFGVLAPMRLGRKNADAEGLRAKAMARAGSFLAGLDA